jgi:hypothetical protein
MPTDTIECDRLGHIVAPAEDDEFMGTCSECNRRTHVDDNGLCSVCAEDAMHKTDPRRDR